jgi:hypothetical protein
MSKCKHNQLTVYKEDRNWKGDSRLCYKCKECGKENVMRIVESEQIKIPKSFYLFLIVYTISTIVMIFDMKIGMLILVSFTICCFSIFILHDIYFAIRSYMNMKKSFIKCTFSHKYIKKMQKEYKTLMSPNKKLERMYLKIYDHPYEYTPFGIKYTDNDIIFMMSTMFE